MYAKGSTFPGYIIIYYYWDIGIQNQGWRKNRKKIKIDLGLGILFPRCQIFQRAQKWCLTWFNSPGASHGVAWTMRKCWLHPKILTKIFAYNDAIDFNGLMLNHENYYTIQFIWRMFTNAWGYRLCFTFQPVSVRKFRWNLFFV